MAGHFQISLLAAGLVLLAVAGCRKAVPPGALVLTQSPASATGAPGPDLLDVRYPANSRIVLAEAPPAPRRAQLLSEGLSAAGGPVISYDGQRVFFVGKTAAGNDWQIYQKDLAGGRIERLTSMPGGAMDPTLLPDGSLVFASPVPGIDGTHSSGPPSALYVQSPGGRPRRLTFSPRRITDPTLLSDGRILFISTQPAGSNSFPGPALFTINNDGTEITIFASLEDPALAIQQPRLLADGRVVFLVSKSGSRSPSGSAEFVRMARPFHSRAPLFPGGKSSVRSVQPANNGNLLVCAENVPGAAVPLALFLVSPDAATLGAPLLAEPDWNECEAVEVSPHPWPMGRLSNVDPTKSTGKVLCLNANFSSDYPGGTMPVATHVRVLAETSPGKICALGKAPVQTDGSFLVEVPADVPLGFETLDENDRVLRREEPMLWVRPGENRSCIGCHEPHNRSPKNHRPLAVGVAVPCLSLNSAKLGQKESAQ
jgi:hypothetical protein